MPFVGIAFLMMASLESPGMSISVTICRSDGKFEEVRSEEGIPWC
jgi:hypothetical protein